MFDHLKSRLEAHKPGNASEPDLSPLALPAEAFSAGPSNVECKLAYHPAPARPPARIPDEVDQRVAQARQLNQAVYEKVRLIGIAYHHDEHGSSPHSPPRFINVDKGTSDACQKISLLKKVLENDAENAGDENVRQTIAELRPIGVMLHDIAIEQTQALREEPNSLDMEDEEDSDPASWLHSPGKVSFAQMIPDID